MLEEVRNRPHHQKFLSETKTLCRTIWSEIVGGEGEEGTFDHYCDVTVRIPLPDGRIILTPYVIFEPDGGGARDDASILMENQSLIAASALILANRHYIPYKRLIGNRQQGARTGMVTIPNREGTLGFAFDIDCTADAVEIELRLYPAYGAIIHPSMETRYGGRWMFGYRFFAQERLSREEFMDAIKDTHANYLRITGDTIG